jgi:8-oxo-dGTP diphosphatase
MAMMDWTDWKPTERAVLVFLRDEDQLLLIHKKRGLGKGKVNGPGGRLETGETWREAGIRETQEETGITPENLVEVADIKFQFTDGYALDVQVFLGRGWSGSLTACDEADPFWLSVYQLPWTQMWADDALWLPQVLNGQNVTARFVFEGEQMREADLEVRQRPIESMNG